MFSTILRYLYTIITLVDNCLLHPLYLISQHYGIFLTCTRHKVLQGHTTLHLFYRYYLYTLLMQLTYSLYGILIIRPFHSILCPKRSLMYLYIRWCCCYATQAYPLYPKGIRCAEYRPYII